MDAQSVAHTLNAYAKLGRQPEEALLEALRHAAGRVAGVYVGRARCPNS